MSIVETDVDVKTKVKVQRPKMYHIIFLNDDYTPMDFVVRVLEEIFFKSHDDALAIMLEVHHFGKAIVDTLTKEIADEKATDTMNIALSHGFPLRVIVEPAKTNDD